MEDFLTALVALRWPLVACAFLVLGALLAVAWDDLSRVRRQLAAARRREAELEQDLRDAIRTNRILRHGTKRRPIIAGRVTQ